ncbi:DUF7674 family protein [Lancefieldella rimae]
MVNEKALNTLLLKNFPGLKNKFDECTSWQDGIETGCFLIFEDLLLPLAKKSIQDNDSKFAKRLSEFIEYLICSDDEYAVNVATVGILEGLKSMGNDELVSKTLGSRSLEVFRNLNY